VHLAPLGYLVRILAVVLLLGAMLLAGGLRLELRSATLECPDCNVVLISIDTLRAVRKRDRPVIVDAAPHTCRS